MTTLHPSRVSVDVLSVVIFRNGVDEPLNRRDVGLGLGEMNAVVVESENFLSVVGLSELSQFPSSSPTVWTSACIPMVKDAKSVA